MKELVPLLYLPSGRLICSVIAKAFTGCAE
ncbi:MAG: hypothetical protein QG632_715 [Candidatus Dependentiae bacterium]|nr:hypothetical protein [Candidatus Dependentiae bacterium]